MSEVSFGNIELPLEQKKFFFFYFISVDASAFVSAQLYMNVTVIMHEVIQSIITYSRWSWVSSDVPNVDVDDITHVQAVMIRERIKEKFRNKWSYLFICCHFQTISQAKKLTQLLVFPPKPFFVVIQVHLRQVLVRPIAPHPSVPTLPGQCKAT